MTKYKHLSFQGNTDAIDDRQLNATPGGVALQKIDALLVRRLSLRQKRASSEL
jgi:hypothetical protein